MAQSQMETSEASSKRSVWNSPRAQCFLIFHSDPEDPEVAIYVGLTPSPFLMRKSSLCKHTNFFNDRISKSLERGKPDFVNLPEFGVHEFGLFHHWSLTDKDFGDYDGIPDIPGALIRVFVLARRLGILDLQNEAITSICFQPVARQHSPDSDADDNSAKPQIQPHDIYCAYNQTHPGSPLRRLLVDIFCTISNYNSLDPSLDNYPPRFLADIITALPKDSSVTEHVNFEEEAGEYYEFSTQHTATLSPKSQ